MEYKRYIGRKSYISVTLYIYSAVPWRYVTPLNATLLQPSQPVLPLLAAAALGEEPLRLSTLSGGLKVSRYLLWWRLRWWKLNISQRS